MAETRLPRVALRPSDPLRLLDQRAGLGVSSQGPVDHSVETTSQCQQEAVVDLTRNPDGFPTVVETFSEPTQLKVDLRQVVVRQGRVVEPDLLPRSQYAAVKSNGLEESPPLAQNSREAEPDRRSAAAATNRS